MRISSFVGENHLETKEELSMIAARVHFQIFDKFCETVLLPAAEEGITSLVVGSDTMTEHFPMFGSAETTISVIRHHAQLRGLNVDDKMSTFEWWADAGHKETALVGTVQLLQASKAALKKHKGWHPLWQCFLQEAKTGFKEIKMERIEFDKFLPNLNWESVELLLSLHGLKHTSDHGWVTISW